MIMKLAMGIYDAPQQQQQPVFTIDNLLSHIAVFGGPMSGKTTFIKTFLIQLYKYADKLPPEDVYIIDFGGNMGAYGRLKNVCACFDSKNEENIKRVFKVIEHRLEENSKRLASQSFYAIASKHPVQCPAHITLIIENVNSFLGDERYASYQEKLLQFCRDGLSKGLSVVLTLNDVAGTGRLMANIGQKIVFDMPADNYFEIFNQKVSKPMRLPGRSIVNIGSFTYECQIALPFEDLNDQERVGMLVERSDAAINPNRILSFPETLSIDNITTYCDKTRLENVSKNELLVGLDYYEHAPVTVDMEENRAIAIYGKRRFGKTNLLSGMIEKIFHSDPKVRFVYMEDGRNGIKDLYSRYSDRSRRFFSVLELMGFLIDEGYVVQNYTPLKKVSTEIKKNPFTVFVIQGRSFFQNLNHARNLLSWFAEDMIVRADEEDYLFIFSDVRNFSEPEMQARFNNMLSSAFLLDNIGEFVVDRGNKSVFKEMDAKELKSQYAKCSIGDGYYYVIEKDDLKKLKFIQHI